MSKFIVRDHTGEFWTCLNMESIEAANAHMVDIVSKMRAMGGNLVYTVEPEPVAPLFEEYDPMDDFNYVGSRHHY